MTTTSDLTLLARLRAGEADAWTTLAQRHRPPIVRYVAAMIGDAEVAEDVVQESLRRALERIEQLEDVGRIGSWLLTIAVNLCRDRLKRARAPGSPDAAGSLPEAVPAGRRTALSSLVRREDAAVLAVAIDRLPILLREAFLLRHIEGLSYAEMAPIADTAARTLQVRCHRARALLRLQLGSLVDERWASDPKEPGE